MRFFAALAVFFFHVSLVNSPIPPHGPVNPFADPDIAAGFERALRHMGYVGVSFFFILSGFVITWATGESYSIRRFMWRRLLKIYPSHAAMWLLALALFAGAYTSVPTALTNLLLLHPMSPDPGVYVSVNPPSWSLSCDLLFYLLFPAMIPLVRAIPERRLVLAGALAFLGMLVVVQVTQFVIPAEPKSPITPISAMQLWFGYIFPGTRLVEFVLGMIAARIAGAGRWPSIGLLPIFAALAASYALSMRLPFLYSFGICYAIPLVALIATLADKDAKGTTPGVLEGDTMQFLGRVSFGFYLVQGVSIFFVSRWLGGITFGAAGGAAMILGYFAGTLFLGWVLYRMVEEPAMRLGPARFTGLRRGFGRP